MLLFTAWYVSATLPGAPTSVWTSVFAGVGLLYGGPVPMLLTVQEGPGETSNFLKMALLLHLLPFGLSVWGATAWLEGTAYDFLVPWCWGVLAACVVLAVAGALWRLFKRK